MNSREDEVSGPDECSKKRESGSGQHIQVPDGGKSDRPREQRNKDSPAREGGEHDGDGLSTDSLVAFSVLEVLRLNRRRENSRANADRKQRHSVERFAIRSYGDQMRWIDS